MKIVYAIVLSSGSYDSHNTTYLRAYSTREAALELIKALAAEMLQFEAEYKKTKPGAKFGVSYDYFIFTYLYIGFMKKFDVYNF